MASPRPLLYVAAAGAVLAGALGSLVVAGAFALTQEHVAEHLCENRHDPDSDCDGKCFLKERMEAMDSHHGHGETDAPAVMPTPPVLLAVAADGATVPPDRWRTAPAPPVWALLGAANGAPGEVFRPPERG